MDMLLIREMWDTTTDITLMCRHIVHKENGLGGYETASDCHISERKIRLFCCACCALFMDKLPADFYKYLSVAEDYSDGLVEYAAICNAHDAVALHGGLCQWGEPWKPHNTPARLLAWTMISNPYNAFDTFAEFGRNLISGMVQCKLLREIANNPYYTYGYTNVLERTLSPSHPSQPGDRSIYDEWLDWNNGAIPRLAQYIYDYRTFSEMPILGDMLEDAGCTDQRILDHCHKSTVCPRCNDVGTIMVARGEPTQGTETFPCPECHGHKIKHVRGCWVLDLLLKKS